MTTQQRACPQIHKDSSITSSLRNLTHDETLHVSR